MDVVQFCEMGLLILFGVSWPFNIIKSIQSKTTKGKSVQFEITVICGYCFGLVGKFYSFAQTGQLPYVVWFYFADIAMVLIDVCLYFRNLKLDKQREAQAGV